jgi:CheY-like chemotaxis protein
MSIVKFPSLKRTRVMIASPNRFFRSTVGEILSAYGYVHQVSVETVKSVIDNARRYHTDFILVDEDMPFLTPFELVRMLRGDAHLNPVPELIVVAARPTRAFIDEAREVGFDAVITKPVIPIRLIGVIEQLQNVRSAA